MLTQYSNQIKNKIQIQDIGKERIRYPVLKTFQNPLTILYQNFQQ